MDGSNRFPEGMSSLKRCLMLQRQILVSGRLGAGAGQGVDSIHTRVRMRRTQNPPGKTDHQPGKEGRAVFIRRNSEGVEEIPI